MDLFLRSPAGRLYASDRGTVKCLRKLGKYGEKTQETVKQLNASLGSAGMTALAKAIRGYVSEARADRLVAPLNPDLAGKMVDRIEVFLSDIELDAPPYNLEKLPEVFGRAVGMNSDSFVVLWILAGAPGGDGKPVKDIFPRGGYVRIWTREDWPGGKYISWIGNQVRSGHPRAK